MAMLKFAKACNWSTESERLKYLGKLDEDYVRFHFDSSRKRMSTILNIPSDEVGQTAHNYPRRIHMKGASEIVLSCVSHYLNEDGERIELLDT